MSNYKWNLMRINCVAKGLGFRHLQVVLLFCGLAIAFGLRVNLSVGIVAMTSNDTNAGEVCLGSQKQTNKTKKNNFKSIN